eukprot:499803-Pleurochrysis_carterae.AAC.2
MVEHVEQHASRCRERPPRINLCCRLTQLSTRSLACAQALHARNDACTTVRLQVVTRKQASSYSHSRAHMCARIRVNMQKRRNAATCKQ